MAYFDILILAAVAAFLGYRLWSILGTHDPDKPVRRSKNTMFIDDDEEPIRPIQRAQAVDVEEEEVQVPPRFNPTQFLEGG